MPFYREGVEDVRAFTLPEAVADDGRGVALSSAALVTWHSCHATRLHQVYVNGCLAGATIDPQQRRLVVQARVSLHAAVRVEVVAVDPEDAHTDFTDQLDPPPAQGRIRLVLLRSQTLPLGAKANVYFDNGSGQIDYDMPLNASPIPIWACPQDKAGFGMAQFGTSDFGYDSAAAIGFGKGSFGHGQFGLDADTVEWISPPLPLGRYRFGVRILDLCGNESAGETAPMAVVPAPRPGAALSSVAFDPQTNQLTLRVSE
jgi:hypothetical protein